MRDASGDGQKKNMRGPGRTKTISRVSKLILDKTQNSVEEYNTKTKRQKWRACGNTSKTLASVGQGVSLGCVLFREGGDEGG